MKREHLLAHIRVAAYENDTAKLVRLFVENRISRPAFDEQVAIGRRMKEQESKSKN
jgi:hypothetical protein